MSNHDGTSPTSGRRAYAGIGSRATTAATLALMRQAAAWLAARGWLLRTGLAPGADQAFYTGAIDAAGAVELYLPWPSFETAARRHAPRQLVLDEPSPAAYEIAARFHPAWDRLRPGARRLHARNSHQLLGADLEHPVAFVLCWTPGAAMVGGTAQALRIADAHGVPILNLARPEHARRVQAKLPAAA